MGPIAFPFKLWAIVERSSASDNESPRLIQWGMDSNSIVIDEINFEALVATIYPRFLRRNTLDSLLKQLHQYRFVWVDVDIPGMLQYWHPMFIRGRMDLLPQVTSR